MRVLTFVAALCFATSVQSETISGVAHVVDGDTIDIGDRRIRIEGIDAFETAQSCRDEAGARWPCGTAAKKALLSLIGEESVTCRIIRPDGYARYISACRVGSVDIGAAMVKTGLAFAFRKYSETYVADEVDAFKGKMGAWKGEFTFPWTFRRNGWAEAAQSAPIFGCPIKGNIRNGKRIYHLPYMPDYQRTRIDILKGEKWFCNELEALQAGWRPPLNY